MPTGMFGSMRWAYWPFAGPFVKTAPWCCMAKKQELREMKGQKNKSNMILEKGILEISVGGVNEGRVFRVSNYVFFFFFSLCFF